MNDMMMFPNTVEEFMQSYKITDTEGIYISKGAELVPIFRMRQWFEHLPEYKTGQWVPQDHNYMYGNTKTSMYFPPVCSECGHTGDFNMNYCPNCGADMRGETNG